MKDISVSFATTAYIQVLNIATGLIAARILLPEGRGELAALMLWPGLIAELGNLGLSDALLYRLSAARIAPKIVFGTALLLTLALCAFLIPIGLAILPFAMATLDAEIMAAAHWYMILFLPIYFASLFVANMFQGKLDLMAWNFVRAIVPTLYLLGIIVLGLTIAPEAPEFVGANLVAMLASAAAGIMLLVQRGWFGWRPDGREAKAMLLYGAKSHLSEILHSLRSKLDQAVVAKLMAAADLGFYAVSLTVANGPLILVQTVANVAFPKISAQPDHAGKIIVFGSYLRLCLALVLAVDLALFLTNWFLIPLLFGRAFADSVLTANLLLIGLVPFAAKLMCASALKAWDRALAIPRAEIWGLAVIALALLVLVPRFGLVGAAIANVIAQCVSAAVLGFTLAHELDVHPVRLMRPTASDLANLRAALAKVLGRG